jgi:hypothetical protein
MAHYRKLSSFVWVRWEAVTAWVLWMRSPGYSREFPMLWEADGWIGVRNLFL